MLHVLFILLKILGILLLLLIGLILLVLLTPIRYSFGLKKEEQASPEFTIRVTWLFWIFYFKTSYIDKVFDYRVRILGHQIAGNQKDFLEKQKERANRKEQKERKREERRKKKDSRDKNSHKKEESSEKLPVTATEKELDVKKNAEEDIFREEKAHEYPDGKKVQKPEEKEAASSEESLSKPDTKKKETKESGSRKKKQNKQEDKQEKDSVFKKMKNRINSIKETKSAIDKLPWREWLELGKDIFIRFLKHVLPRKLEGTVTFGMSDPADTGYITAIAAIFYPRYGEHFSLYPDFERKMFAAQCRGKGRIRPGYMLVLVVSILKEKSVRTMIKNIILG